MVDWELILTNLASGAWTVQRAMDAAGIATAARLEAEILTAARGHMGPRIAELAQRTIVRYGITEGGGVLVAGTAAGGVSGILGTIGGWLGLTGGAAVAAGAVIVTAVLGVAAYGVSEMAGSRAGYTPIEAGPRVTDRGDATAAAEDAAPCPDMSARQHKCPWSPEGYTVEPCTPGFCFDSGPRGTGACKQENRNVPGATGDDLYNIYCTPEFPNAVRDRCTNELVSCNK